MLLQFAGGVLLGGAVIPEAAIEWLARAFALVRRKVLDYGQPVVAAVIVVAAAVALINGFGRAGCQLRWPWQDPLCEVRTMFGQPGAYFTDMGIYLGIVGGSAVAVGLVVFGFAWFARLLSHVPTLKRGAVVVSILLLTGGFVASYRATFLGTTG